MEFASVGGSQRLSEPLLNKEEKKFLSLDTGTSQPVSRGGEGGGGGVACTQVQKLISRRACPTDTL